MRGGAFLLKTENGQYQLVNVAPSLPVTSSAGTMPGTYRLQVPVSAPNSAGVGQVMRNVTPQQMTVTLPASMASAIRNSQAQVTQPLTIQTTAANNNSSAAPSQMSPNTAKKKCKNFLSTLIRLASDQPEQVATNVKNLIQGLIVCVGFVKFNQLANWYFLFI